MKTALNMARPMMSVYDAPLQFWDWTVKLAEQNRMPCMLLTECHV